jgi:hypothetical protein
MGHDCGQTETPKVKRQCLSHLAFYFLLFCCCVFFLQVSCQEQAKMAEANTLQQGAKEPSPNEPEAETTTPKPAAGEEKSESTPSKTAVGPGEAGSARPKPAARPQRPESKPKVSAAARPQFNRPRAKVRFEKVVHDFGEIGPGTTHSCEFRFTNTGIGMLKIVRIQAPCGCTVPELKKKQYRPGEPGILKVTYSASTQPISARKYVYVHTNDAADPKVTLTIKAKIAPKVNYEPKRLNLLLKDENAGCPKIMLTSIDKKPFSITAFRSSGNCISADLDSSVEATKFVLPPKVNLEKLGTAPNGLINISLTHPECKRVAIAFNALAKYKITPAQRIIVLKAEPNKPIARRLWVLNNYGEDFEIESVSSRNKLIKVLSQKKVSKGYQFDLEITPPASEDKRTVFTDVLSIHIKGAEILTVDCRGFYLRKKE